MRRFILSTVAAALLAAVGVAQDVADDVVKITSKIVQVDVVVTDDKGNQVTDLTAADFQIFQDGKLKRLSGFSYIPLGSATLPPPEAGRSSKKDQVAIPPTTSRRTARGRVIAFIVDDGNCRASFVGMTAAREGLERFVNEQIQPGDLVAIYQTRSGSSMFQQYTSDKAQLLRAARKIRWYPSGGGCASNDGSFFEAARRNTDSISTSRGVKSLTLESDAERARRELSEDQARDKQIIGSLGVLRYAIRGLDRVAGRKVLFFLSDGLPLISRDRRILEASEFLRDITETANRSAVVINTIDTRGIFDAGMIEARDDVSTIDDPLASEKISNERRRDSFSAQDGLAFLAGETGGKFYKNENYLHAPIGRALSIEKGFYLVAYEPDDESFKGKNFNKIEVKVTRPGLRVSSRAGFFGVPDQTATKRASKSAYSELYEAIVEPLPGSGMDLGLTAYFGNTPAEGNFVRSLVHISGADISFTDEPGGFKKAVVDVVAVTMNEKNEVIDEFTHAHIVKVPAAAMPLIEKNGLVYSADVKVKKPGFYNFRVALRDVNSGKLGTVSQVVQVPELKSSRLFLSGLVATQVDDAGKFSLPATPDPNNAFALPSSTGVPAIRRFRRGSVIAYPYVVYDSKLASNGKPNLTVEVNVYKDGKLLVDGKPATADLQPQSDWSRINDFGYLRLNPNLSAGDYVLQVIVRDLESGKNAESSQWSEFQIVD